MTIILDGEARALADGANNKCKHAISISVESALRVVAGCNQCPT